MIKLIRYNDTMWSLVSFNEDILKRSQSKITRFIPKETTKYSKEEIERISLSRTKSRIKEYCLCNDFQYFFTCTVSSSSADRFNLQEVQDKMKKICHKIKRNNKDFAYIFITECHKNGAFHFHGMAKNLDRLYKNDNGYLSCSYFDELGFNSFDTIKDYNKCCNYITKYITKNCIRNENNQVYFCSRGLNRADSDYMVDYDLDKIFEGSNKVFHNEFCSKIDFDINTLSPKHKFNLYNYFNYNNELLRNDKEFVTYITNWLQLLTSFDINYIKDL